MRRKPETIYRAGLKTPVGWMAAMATEKGLCALEFDKPGRMALLKRRLAHWHGGPQIKEGSNRILTQTERWLKHYFKREFTNLRTPPLDLRGTAFEKRVWRE